MIPRIRRRQGWGSIAVQCPPGYPEVGIEVGAEPSGNISFGWEAGLHFHGAGMVTMIDLRVMPEVLGDIVDILLVLSAQGV